MTSKHVLMLTGIWPPLSTAGTHRPLRLAHRLPALGWKTTVLTPTVTRNPYESRMKLDFDMVEPTDVDVLRPTTKLPLWRFRRRLAQSAELIGQSRNFERITRRFLWHPAFFKEWTRGALKTAIAAHKHDPFDVIWVTGNPWGIFLTARSVARVLNIPLVLDYRDPWTANPDAPQLRGFRARYQRSLEAKCVKIAAGIAYVHPRCLTENERVFGRPKGAKWRVIYNGFTAQDNSLPHLGTEQPTVIHGGHCYAGRSAVPVLKALQDIEPVSRPRVRFFGNLDVPAEQWLKAQETPSSFEHLGLVQSDEIIGHMRGSAAQLLLVGPQHAHAIPSKVFDYMQSGRPVIGIGPLHAEVRNIVEGCGLGVWCSPEDHQGIINALLMAREGTLPFTPNAAQIEKFSADNMAIETASLLREVCR